MEISGKTALVTGATGGLGRAIAQALADHGGRIVASSRKAEELDALIEALPGHGHTTVVSDLAVPGAATRVIAEAGEIDILVANAGLPGTGYLDSFSAEQIERAVRVNLESPMLQAHALLPTLLAKGSGHLVFIASISGVVASPCASVYNGTKFGLRGFALGLRQDLRGTGVGASVVLPGAIRDAGIFADSGAAPPPGLGTATPEEVAEAVIRSIEKNRREVMVAPRRQRVASRLGTYAPGAVERLSATAKQTAEAIARGSLEKR